MRGNLFGAIVVIGALVVMVVAVAVAIWDEWREVRRYERRAAADYAEMIGMNLPIEERLARHRKAGLRAPVKRHNG